MIKQLVRTSSRLFRVIISYKLGWRADVKIEDLQNDVAELSLEIGEMETFKECIHVLSHKSYSAVGYSIGKTIASHRLSALCSR